jgi:GT2 family glycosyltransferase
LAKPRVTVVIPTLAADSIYRECVRSLEKQTLREIEVVVVDNSGKNKVRQALTERNGLRIVTGPANLGFGAAVNLGWRNSTAPYLATLNDDAVAHPDWLKKLVETMDKNPQVGMCASQVRLTESGKLDSAGMLIAADGSSKQRGHNEAPEKYSKPAEVIFPSGSAAIYRRKMIEEIGAFDENFFLYCEDTDLGLRAHWADWKCMYAPAAVVDHMYSHSAGRASPMKAYLVERNRLCAIVKNFPLRILWKAPWLTMVRYSWHLLAMIGGEGAAGQFRAEGNPPAQLAWFVCRAHISMLASLPRLLRERRAIRKLAKIGSKEFCAVLEKHAISLRQVASL